MYIPTNGEIVKQRNKYGITQADCAKALDVSERQWRRYENGDTIMSGPFWVFFKNRKMWPKS